MSTDNPENEEVNAEEPKQVAPVAEAKPKAKKPAKVVEEITEVESKEEAPKDEVPEKAKKVAKKVASKDVEEPIKEAAASDENDSAEGKPEEKKGETSALQDLLGDDLSGIKIRRAKGSKNITHGIVHVIATFNNTKVSVTDTKGNVISWSSAGKCNFRGSRKSTAYAAQVVTQEATRAAMAHGLKEVAVHLKGPGLGRDSAVRALQALGMIIVSIVDKTPVPHNGCRAPKRRRV
jgi:small subunit ribosomal protein S11